MKSKLKWCSILLMGLVLLLVPVIGCGYNQEDLDSAHEEGYADGYRVGYDEGYDKGYIAGLAQCDSDEEEQDIIIPLDEDKLPSGAIQWYEAGDHIGDRITVCGPVVDAYWASGSSGKPTFLNIGEPYPDPDRFTIVIWIENRGKFPHPPEDYYLGKTICITGLITEYDGIAQIEATAPDQIQDP